MIIKENDTRNQIPHYCGVGITYHPEKSKQSRLEKVIEYAIRRRTEMVAEKSGPSFAYADFVKYQGHGLTFKYRR